MRGSDPVTDPYNAAITWLAEPLQGAAGGPLAGRTLLVKDLIDTAGIRTTYGSQIYADHVPKRHATVVQRALDAGATIVGKGNLPEFAWGVLGANPWYGTVHNPLHPGKTTGGSSAGNAAAIAAGLVELGIGTDTGCSIRLPCGRVWNRRPQVAVGAPPARRRVPALPLARYGRADGADGRGRRAPLVGARRKRGARAAPRRPHRRVVAAGAGPRRRARDRDERRRARRGLPTSSDSAPASSSRSFQRRRPTSGRSFSTRRQ